jgi:hypothetical protein
MGIDKTGDDTSFPAIDLLIDHRGDNAFNYVDVIAYSFYAAIPDKNRALLP